MIFKKPKGVTMATNLSLPEKVDPVAFLDCILSLAWQSICNTFDVIASEVPGMQVLFHDANLSMPQQAAECVLVNMLLEAVERIGRFSPWYTKPACKFGLYALHDEKMNHPRWILTPEAMTVWQDTLKTLQVAIKENSGLIQASLLIDQFTLKELSNGQQTTAQCQCSPPKLICVKKEILEKSTISCAVCQHEFVAT